MELQNNIWWTENLAKSKPKIQPSEGRYLFPIAGSGDQITFKPAWLSFLRQYRAKFRLISILDVSVPYNKIIVTVVLNDHLSNHFCLFFFFFHIHAWISHFYPAIVIFPGYHSKRNFGNCIHNFSGEGVSCLEINGFWETGNKEMRLICWRNQRKKKSKLQSEINISIGFFFTQRQICL